MQCRNTLADEGGSDAPPGGFYFRELGQELLDLRFFVGDVLAHDGIEFLGLHLVRMQTLVLGGRVIVTGAGGGDEFDLIAHENAP
jgi:hypothetical protein